MAQPSDSMTALIVDCWKNPELKQQLIQNPKEILQEYGIEFPKGKDVHIHENSNTLIHVTIPEEPTQLELTDEELEHATGGITKPIAVDIKI